MAAFQWSVLPAKTSRHWSAIEEMETAMPRPAKGIAPLVPGRSESTAPASDRERSLVHQGRRRAVSPQAALLAKLALRKSDSRSTSPQDTSRRAASWTLSKSTSPTLLSIYDADARDKQANQRAFDASVERLAQWWGGKMLLPQSTASRAAPMSRAGRMTISAGTGSRRASARARQWWPRRRSARDLETLRAAINSSREGEGCTGGIVRVALPQSGDAKDRWLTRS